MQVNLQHCYEESITPFNVFWEESFLLDHVVEETNRYEEQRPLRDQAVGHHIRWFPVAREEMQAFLAITIVMGYNNYVTATFL